MTNEVVENKLREMYDDACYIEESLDAVEAEESISIAISALKENTKLKAEIERLMELMPKICETCEYEDESGYEEPCNSCNNRRNWKLKSEE